MAGYLKINRNDYLRNGIIFKVLKRENDVVLPGFFL